MSLHRHSIAYLFGWFLQATLYPVQAAQEARAGFVGSTVCAECHEAEQVAWSGSDHDLAMTEPSEKTVLGDFSGAELTAHGVTSAFFSKDGDWYVRTDGPDGELHDYRIAYTFGWYPLQQYLVAFPRGRLQSLGLAWDSRPKGQGGQRWFHLYPGEEHMDHRHPLHWTRREQTWNYQCAECHSTGLEKNYRLETDSYATTWAEIDVACEACHGPGAEHATQARAVAAGSLAGMSEDKGLVVDLSDRDGGVWTIDPQTGAPRRSVPRSGNTEVELCACCRSRRGVMHEPYEYGKPLGNSHRLSLMDEGLYYPDGQILGEVYVYGSFIQSKMFRAGVTCSDCHDAHSLKLRLAGDQVCAQCHTFERYAAVTHHHHPPGTPGSSCIACHMPQKVYMVNDERADHGMRVPRPDLTLKIGSPNACNQCLQATGDTAGALDMLADAHRRHPGSREVLVALATIHRDSGNRDQAMKYAQELRQRYSDDPAAAGLVRELTVVP